MNDRRRTTAAVTLTLFFAGLLYTAFAKFSGLVPTVSKVIGSWYAVPWWGLLVVCVVPFVHGHWLGMPEVSQAERWAWWGLSCVAAAVGMVLTRYT